jgi:hypothetical protein
LRRAGSPRPQLGRRPPILRCKAKPVILVFGWERPYLRVILKAQIVPPAGRVEGSSRRGRSCARLVLEARHGDPLFVSPAIRHPAERTPVRAAPTSRTDCCPPSRGSLAVGSVGYDHLASPDELDCPASTYTRCVVSALATTVAAFAAASALTVQTCSKAVIADRRCRCRTIPTTRLEQGSQPLADRELLCETRGARQLCA